MRCVVNKLLVITLFLTMLLGSAEGASFGIKAGMNIADMHGSDIGGMKIGFIGGGFVTIVLGAVFAIQPEILYTQKGYRWEQEYLGVIYKETATFNYIEIPMLAKITIPVKGNVKPYFLIGLYFGVNLIAKKKIEIIEPPYERDVVYSKDSEFGLVFGEGLDLILGKGKIGFEGRYTSGLTTSSEIWARNSVISFMLGYSF